MSDPLARFETLLDEYRAECRRFETVVYQASVAALSSGRDASLWPAEYRAAVDAQRTVAHEVRLRVLAAFQRSSESPSV